MKKMMVLFAAIAAVVFAAKAESITFTVPAYEGVTREITGGTLVGDEVTVEPGDNVQIEYRDYRDHKSADSDKYFFAGEAGGVAYLTITLTNIVSKEAAEGQIAAAFKASPITPVSEAVCKRGSGAVLDRKYFTDLQEAIDKKASGIVTQGGDRDALILLKNIVVTDWIDLRTENTLFLRHYTITKGEPWKNSDHNALIRVSAASNIHGYGIKPGTDPKDGEYIPAQLLFPGDLDYAILVNDDLQIGGFGSGGSSSASMMVVRGNKAAICVACESKSDLVVLGYGNQFVCDEDGGAGIVLEKGKLGITDDVKVSGETGILASGTDSALAIAGDAQITGKKVGIKADGCEYALLPKQESIYFGVVKDNDCAVNVTGGTIVATEEGGVALEIVNHGGTTAKITGGTFEAPNGQAVVSKGEGAEPITGFIELGSIEKGTSKFLGKTETPKEYIDTPIQGWEKYTDPETGKEYVIPVVGEVGWPASWPTEVDETVKSRFATWKKAYNLEDTYNFEGKEWAFLLNTDPNGEVKKLHIDSITPNYSETKWNEIPRFVISAGGVNLGTINGILYLSMGKELNGRVDVANSVDSETNLPKIACGKVKDGELVGSSGEAFSGVIGKPGDEWGEGNLLVFMVKYGGGYCDNESGFFQAKIGFKAPAAE